MHEYQIYCVGENNVVVHHKDFLLPDDPAALERARDLCRSCGAEVWEGTRFVTKLAQNGEPSGSFRHHQGLFRSGGQS
jgi:hypothetical protein